MPRGASDVARWHLRMPWLWRARRWIRLRGRPRAGADACRTRRGGVEPVALAAPEFAHLRVVHAYRKGTKSLAFEVVEPMARRRSAIYH